MNFFGGDHREPITEIESHLMAENRECAGACAVFFLHTFIQNPTEQIMVLFHAKNANMRSEACKLERGADLFWSEVSLILTFHDETREFP